MTTDDANDAEIDFVERVRVAASKGKLNIVDTVSNGDGASLMGVHMPEHWLDSASFWFDAEIDPDSIKPGVAEVIDKTTGESIDVMVGLAGGHVLTVQPVQPLTNKSTYDFVLGSGVRDTLGRSVNSSIHNSMVK